MHAVVRIAVLSILATSVFGLVGSTSARAESRRCSRATKYFQGDKPYRGTRGAKKLRRLLVKDPGCVGAADAALTHVLDHWTKIRPKAEGRVSAAGVAARWRKFQRDAAFVQAIVAFQKAPVRPKAALALGHLYESMATYLAEVGNAPEEMVVIRESPESLYHTRAVDLAEFLLIRAETSYDLVERLLSTRAPDSGILADARTQATTLRQRYKDRARESAERRERLAREEVEALPPLNLPE